MALLAALGVLWGSAYIFIREGIVLGASPLLYACVRYLISAAIFGALGFATREAWPSRRAAAISAIVGGPLVIGFYGGLLYVGEQYTTGGYASVLAASAPILTLLIAYLLLPHERPGSVALAGLGVGFVGVVVLVLPTLGGGDVGVWPGPIIIVGAFLSTALGTVLLRRIGGGRQGFWQLGVQFAVGGGILAGAAAALPLPEALPLTDGVLVSLAGLVVLSSILGYFVYFTLHHRIGPLQANSVAYILPVVGVGIGSGLLGEPFGLFELAGSLVVIAGVTLVLWGSRRGGT